LPRTARSSTFELSGACGHERFGRYVFCVNVDAVIAALLLAVLWKDYRSGALSEKDLETAAFNVFLYGRMIGAPGKSTTTSIAAATWIRARRRSSALSWFNHQPRH
jgi:hypothetical protein